MEITIKTVPEVPAVAAIPEHIEVTDAGGNAITLPDELTTGLADGSYTIALTPNA